MEQVIKVGDIWFDKSGENPVIVLVHDKERRSVSFTYLLTINGELDLTESISSVDLFLKTKELMVTSSAENKQYIKGKTAGYNEGYEEATAESQYDYDKGYEDGKSFGVNLGKDDTVFQKQWVDKEKKSSYERGYHDGYKVCDEEKGNSFNSGYNQGCNDASEGLELRKSVLNKEYVKGKTEGYNEGYQHGFTLAKEKITELDEEERKLIESCGYNNGYEEAIAEFELGNDFTNKLEDKYFQKGYSEGYGDAIKEISNSQSLGETTEYVFGTGDCYDSDEGYPREKYTVTNGVDIIDFIKKNFDNIKSFTQVGDVASIEMFDKFNSGVCGSNELEKELSLVEKYPHYYKDIRHLNIIDIYRFFDLFEVTDPCLQHSLKKMAVGGKRGSKDYEKDIKEAMDTLSRWEYMQEENKRGMDD